MTCQGEHFDFFYLVCVLTSFAGATSSDPVHQKLREHLFKSYDETIIPQKATNHTQEVAVGLAMIHIEDLSKTGILTCTAWLRLIWWDFRFQWDEADFGGVSVLRVDSTKIWKPDIEVYNSPDINHYSISNEFKGATNALVYPNGEVLFVPPVNLKVICSNFSHAAWPKGEQECNIKLGSWTHDGFMLNITLYNQKEEIDLTDMHEPSPWQITKQLGEVRNEKMYACCDEPYPDLNYRFLVSPHPDFLVEDPVPNQLSQLINLGIAIVVLLLLLLGGTVIILCRGGGQRGPDMIRLTPSDL